MECTKRDGQVKGLSTDEIKEYTSRKKKSQKESSDKHSSGLLDAAVQRLTHHICVWEKVW